MRFFEKTHPFPKYLCIKIRERSLSADRDYIHYQWLCTFTYIYTMRLCYRNRLLHCLCSSGVRCHYYCCYRMSKGGVQCRRRCGKISAIRRANDDYCWQLGLLLLVTCLVRLFSKCPAEARHVSSATEIVAARAPDMHLKMVSIAVASSHTRSYHGNNYTNGNNNESSDKADRGHHHLTRTLRSTSAARLLPKERLQPLVNNHQPRHFEIALFQKSKPQTILNLRTDDASFIVAGASGGQHDLENARSRKAFCQNRRVAPNMRVQYNTRSEMRARMAHHGDDKMALQSLSNVAKKFSLDLIIGQCQEPLSWLQHVDCSITGNLTIIVYRKCPGYGLDPAIDFSQLPCLKVMHRHFTKTSQLRSYIFLHIVEIEAVLLLPFFSSAC